MTDIRALFCEAVDAATPLLAGPALVERFEKPSALAEFSVRGLAGHLLRAMTTPGTYLDGPEPDAAAPAISAAAYYASVAAAPADLDDPFQRAIRQRGLEAAPDTPEEFPGIWAATMARFRARSGPEALLDRLSLPPAATGLVIATLVEVARIRHGDTAVVRALTRRERDGAAALRVI